MMNRIVRVPTRVQFNKLLAAHGKNNYRVFTLPAQQVRFVASPKKANDAGFIDTLCGVYEDPKYGLDLKPDEMRDGQVYHYVSEFGVMIVAVPCLIAMSLCASFLAWLTFFDSQPSVFRTNPHPYFAINNGKDLHATRNPIMAWTWPFGPHQDTKVKFYYEIRDAIERKKKLVESAKH